MRLKNFSFVIFLCFGAILTATGAFAVDKQVSSNSGLKVPRFVSLSKNKTNVRAGPGQEYPIKWVVIRKSLPVEIIREHGNWRQIKDHEGQEGWVFHTLLSGKRTAIILGDTNVKMYEKPFKINHKKSRILIMLEPFVNVLIEGCSGSMCLIKVSGFSGWVQKKSLWGVYEHENFN